MASSINKTPEDASLFGSKSHNVQIVKICQTTADVNDFSFLQNGGRPTSYICGAHFYHLRGVLGGLYHCAKFG